MTTHATPTGAEAMKEADLQEVMRLVDEYGLNCAAMKDRDESSHALRSRMELLGYIRQLVEAQPAAVAGEAEFVPQGTPAKLLYPTELPQYPDMWIGENGRLYRLAAPAAPLVGEPPRGKSEVDTGWSDLAAAKHANARQDAALQPIATAPKDGAHIVGYDATSNYGYEAAPPYKPLPWACVVHWFHDGWYASGPYGRADEPIPTLTHWRPL